jgi:hypothetical protein
LFFYRLGDSRDVSNVPKRPYCFAGRLERCAVVSDVGQEVLKRFSHPLDGDWFLSSEDEFHVLTISGARSSESAVSRLPADEVPVAEKSDGVDAINLRIILV